VKPARGLWQPSTLAVLRLPAPRYPRPLFLLRSRGRASVGRMADDQSDAPEQLLPVDRQHLLATLSFALTHDSRLAKTQAADVTASIVAERIVAHLDRAGFVVVQKPAVGAAALGRGIEG
jgi:hypothetical protein